MRNRKTIEEDNNSKKILTLLIFSHNSLLLLRDVILVYPGTYKGEGNNNLYFANQVDVRAIDLANRPVFDLAGSPFAVWNPYLPNSTAVGSFFGLIFLNGGASGSAASVLEVRNGSLNVIQCDFNNSVAEDGGAVILSSSVEGTSNPEGTVVTFEKCVFGGNQGGSGAALQAHYNKGRTVVIQNCAFTANAASANGGAIYSDHVSLFISHSQFTSNVASLSGGAILAETTSPKLIGRALHVVIFNSAFTSNMATVYGGAIAMLNQGELDISTSTVASNSLASSNASQSGGGVYASGAVVFDSVTLESNTCGTGGNTSYGGGLALDGDGEATSFIRSSTFQSNGCKYGSDLAALGGSLYASSPIFNRNTNPYQIATLGTSLVRIVDGEFTDRTPDTLHSLLVKGSSRISFDFTVGTSFVLKISQLSVEEHGMLQSSAHLTVADLVFDGGWIQATTTASPLTFTLTVSGIVSEDPESPSDILELSGYTFFNNGTLIIGRGVTFFVTDYFINNDQLYLQEKSTISGRDGDNAVSFFQRGEIYVNSTAYINCNFYDELGSVLILANAGVSSSESLIILGGTALEGNLKISFSEPGLESFDSGNRLRLIRYLELFRSPFASVSSIPPRTIYLDYDLADLYISNRKGSGNGGGLSGGDVAGIVIAVIIGLGALTLAAWYFIIRPQNQQLYQEEVFAHPQGSERVTGEGYGAL
jgi:predicted outer membrane repeat protein